jgi:hypothetical protein
MIRPRLKRRDPERSLRRAGSDELGSVAGSRRRPKARFAHTPPQIGLKPDPEVLAPPSMTILEAIDEVFSKSFTDRESWAAWRSFLKTLFGLPLSEADLEIYRQCTGRSTPPASPSNEAWLVIGRRGGKSFTLALIATYLACFRDWRPHLQAGERGTIMVIAKDRAQARNILGYVKGLMNSVPMLAKLIDSETSEFPRPQQPRRHRSTHRELPRGARLHDHLCAARRAGLLAD